MADPVIQVQGLTKSFGLRVAVENLDLEVARGEMVALLGPNGAGKTTTVRVLSCLLRPTIGSVRVLGKRLEEREGRRFIRSRIGLLTESPGLYDRATTHYNLLYFARLHRLAEPETAVERSLRQLELWDHRHIKAAALSKGLKQRLAIARCLLHEPEIIFLDEPTSGLDPLAARRLRDLLLQLKEQGRTVLLTTHNLAEAERLADRILVMKTRLIAVDTPRALREQLFGHRVRIATSRVASGDVIAQIEKLPFVHDLTCSGETLSLRVEDPERHNSLIVSVLVEAGVGVRWLTDDGASLEDIYMELVDRKRDHELTAEAPR